MKNLLKDKQAPQGADYTIVCYNSTEGSISVIKNEEPIDIVIMTSESNLEAMAACYSKGWSASADKMYKSEAEAVTEIKPKEFKGLGIVHFDEFKYFTNAEVKTTRNVPPVGVFADYMGVDTTLQSITFPSNWTEIPPCMLFNATSVNDVVIPNSVTSIGDFAFYGCSSLTSIDIPNSVTSIGDGAFSGCKGLTSIDIPNSVTSIGLSAFQYCNSLTSVTIPNSVTSIGSSTFESCGITSIDIPNSVTSINNGAFQNCTGLTSIDIPNSVTSIEESAFKGCTSLSSVTYNGVTYTSKSALTSALTSNGVTVGYDPFDNTALSD